MASNHKLTGVIKGRTIARTSNADGMLNVGFTDGSVMTIRTAGNSNSAATGTVRAVRQADTTLDLDMEDGSTLTVTLEDAASSVMVRDKEHRMEYAD